MDKENYRRINEPINSTLYSVQNNDYKWGVVDDNGNVVVEFGKYAWIDGFQNGLAKVIGHNDNMSPNKDSTLLMCGFEDVDATDMPKRYEQGIINEAGEEVLPLDYNIWKFYGKDYPTIIAIKEGIKYKLTFSGLNPNLKNKPTKTHHRHNFIPLHEDDDFVVDNSDYDRLEDAFDSGEYVPEDW